MTKVNINSANHQVEIEHEGAELAHIVRAARKLWRQTVPPTRGEGPAYGFSADRRGAPDLYGTDADGR